MRCVVCKCTPCRDHARGNEALLKDLPELQVYGGDERITGLTHKVTNGQELKVSVKIRIIKGV